MGTNAGNLLWQPLLPVFGEFVGVCLGHRNQRADVFGVGRVLLEMDFVDEMFHRTVTPLIDLLGEQKRDVTAAQVGELGGQGIDRNTFHGAGLPFQCVVGKQRPAADHRPTGDIGVGLHDLLDLGGGVLGRFLVVIGVADGDARILFRDVFHALNALLEVRRILIVGKDGDGALAAHQLRQFIYHLFAAFYIVDGIGNKPFAVRRVGVEGGHRNAVLHRGIDGVGQFVGVRATDSDAVRADQSELFDGFGLFLGVLFIGRAPVYLDVDAVFFAQV